MKIYFILIFSIATLSLSAQVEEEWWDTIIPIDYSGTKGLSCTPNPLGDYTYYSDIDTWIPRGGSLPLQNIPEKIIQVNINVFQRSNGTGNFTNTVEDRQELINYIIGANAILGNFAPPSDPYTWVTEIPGYDTKIRLDIGSAGNERIYFYQDDNLYENLNIADHLNKIFAAEPDRWNRLNILFIEVYLGAQVNPNITITNGGSGYTSPPTVVFDPPGAQATAYIANGQLYAITLDKNTDGNYIAGNYSGGLNSVAITLTGGNGSGATASCYLHKGASGFANYPSYNYLDKNSYIAMLHRIASGPSYKLVCHELGHNLDLAHPFSYHYCSSSDYLYDVYGLSPPGICPLQMSSWGRDPFAINGDGLTNNMMCYGPSSCSYLSPMQVGEMHRSLALTSIRRYVKESYSEVPLVLTTMEEWDFNMRLYRDLKINQPGELNLECDIVMPKSGVIEINSFGSFYLKGNVTTNNLDSWNGIVVNNAGYLELSNTKVSNFPIIIKSGGTLKIPDYSVVDITNSGRIEIEAGGYICLESGASVNLEETDNVINLRNGSLSGINPILSGKSGICLSDPTTFNFDGNGSINRFIIDQYIQNITFISEEYISGNNIYAGNNVTAIKSPGPVTIENGTSVIFDAEIEVVLEGDFTVEPGAAFEIR